MRVNRPQWGMPQQGIRNQLPQQNQNNTQPSMQKPQSSVNQRQGETAAMQLARKIKGEQGEKAAGYFLYAVRQFVAPREIAHIEQVLHIKTERDPRDVERTDAARPSNKNMMQLLMNMMPGSKPDPSSLIRMMGKLNTQQGEQRNA